MSADRTSRTTHRTGPYTRVSPGRAITPVRELTPLPDYTPTMKDSHLPTPIDPYPAFANETRASSPDEPVRIPIPNAPLLVDVDAFEEDLSEISRREFQRVDLYRRLVDRRDRDWSTLSNSEKLRAFGGLTEQYITTTIKLQLAQARIKKLEARLTHIVDTLDCAVCRHTLEDAVTLECGHSFCKVCVERWRARKDNRGCPKRCYVGHVRDIDSHDLRKIVKALAEDLKE